MAPSGHWKDLSLSQGEEPTQTKTKQNHRPRFVNFIPNSPWPALYPCPSLLHLNLHMLLGTLYFISPSFCLPVNASWLWCSPSVSTLGPISSFWDLELPTCFLRTDLLGLNTGVFPGLWGCLLPPLSIGAHKYFAQYWQTLIFKRLVSFVLIWIASQLYHTHSCFVKAKSRANDHMGI